MSKIVAGAVIAAGECGENDVTSANLERMAATLESRPPTDEDRRELVDILRGLARVVRKLEEPSSSPPPRAPRLPPRWFVRSFWFAHRGLYRLTGGRVGLWRPKPNRWGAMRLNAVGRRTGLERSVMVGYFQDGPNLVTMAMNGWGEGEPAWWLNVQAHPDIRVDLADGSRLVTGRQAHCDERERLWSRWREIDKNLDGYAARRSTETAVVIFEPRPLGTKTVEGAASLSPDGND